MSDSTDLMMEFYSFLESTASENNFII